uniref:DEAD/SNF2-like helicase n=1 Tax=Pithovirus LCPAC104 TaxID=2506589 RepID=A0A481Z791_9VIRU|nr:MAG: DEAD/SNF2-like helicase [Pithovirus LCPAC104]
MEKEIQLDDLIYTYPDISNKNFQQLITAKKEFQQLKAFPREDVPPRGQFFRHQRLIHLYMLIYDKLLLIHKTGTGKTCAALGSSEMFRISFLDALVDYVDLYLKPKKTHIKRIYILVKGPALEREIRRQLLCKCSKPGEFETEQIKKATTRRAKEANITRELNKWYSIMTYGQFVNRYKENDNDLSIKEEYSGSMFIIDEVHNLIVSEIPDKSITTKKETYRQIKRLFSLIERSKIMLLSATPMINESKDLISVMNLILPSDFQMPIDKDYTTATLEELEPYFRGRVSYIRETRTDAIPEYQGNLLQENYVVGNKEYLSHQIIYESKMSEFQSTSYIEVSETRTEKDAFSIRDQQASNFIFPDGTFGEEGFKKYVSEDSGIFKANDELLEFISSYEDLKQLSEKYAEIIRLSIQDPGNVFIYNNFVKGSGAIVLSLCFKAQGIEPFNEIFPVFEGEDFFGLCPEDHSLKSVERKARIRKIPRYALLTSEVAVEKFDNILNTFNSYENRHGDYIKILIVSLVGKEGINTANVIQVHLVGASWNQTSSYQAISRAIRATSHIALLEERNEIIKVKIYQHASILPRKFIQNEDSIDIHMYKYSERKDIEIKRMERIMKQASIDCHLNRGRNILPGGIDGSPECDYDICDYECFTSYPKEVDMSSYDVLYADDIILLIVEELKDLFKFFFDLEYLTIYKYLNTYEKKYIDRAILKIINDNTKLTNRFGFSCYMQENGNIVYLVDQINRYTKFELTDYINKIDSYIPKNFGDYVIEIMAKKKPKDLKQKLRVIDSDSNEWSAIIESMEVEDKMNLVEETVLNFMKKENDDFDSDIYQRFYQFIFKFDEDYLHILYVLSPQTTSFAVMANFEGVLKKIRILKSEKILQWRDVSKEESIKYRNMIRGEIQKRIEPFENHEIYGIYSYSDNKFRIRNKTLETEKAAESVRSKYTGRICINWEIKDLIDIIKHFNINVPKENSNIYKGKTVKEMENYFIKEGKYNENWTDEDTKFFYKWNIFAKTRKKEDICDILYNYLNENNLIFFL